MWVPGHVGIRGKEAADRAALDKKPTEDLMLFSDLNPLIIIIIKRTSKAPHLVWARSASQ